MSTTKSKHSPPIQLTHVYEKLSKSQTKPILSISEDITNYNQQLHSPTNRQLKMNSITLNKTKPPDASEKKRKEFRISSDKKA